ncbi:MAG: right-handed parallel beta-helix repeat-containing protein, partial [Acidimicrobiia bacterium]|nr:right-handed parallel beta-helix repeat-containing protein [Acidimicrobiia bacterium]
GLTHNFSGSAGDVITATATRIDTGAASGHSSTSEFSAAATVTAAPDPVVLDNVQKGTATLANASSTVAVTIAPVDPSKAFLTFSVRGNDTSPENISISGRLSNATTVTFDRVGTSGNVVIDWSVVEFSSGVTVQRGTVTPGGSTTNVAITSVDLTRSFPLVSMRAGGVIYEGEDWVRARFTSSTDLELATTNTFGNVIEWQVVTYNDATVQSGSVSFGTGDSSRTATVTALDPAKSWLIYNYRTTDGTTTNIGQKLVRGRITNGTTLTFDRSSTGQTIDLQYFVVKFTDATEVRSGNANFTSSATTVNAAVTAVDPARSIGVGGYAQTGGRSSYTANDNPGVGWFTSRLTSSTNLRVQRSAALAGADLGWFVMHWPGPAAPLLVNSTGNASDTTPGDGYCDTSGTNADGAPECTLRAAIQEANANAYVDTIDFNIPATDGGHSGGIWTIAPGSELPQLTDGITLDATTQPGWTTTPVVELNGTGAGAGSDGLRVFAADVTIRGFAINRFAADGIEVDTTASNALIAGNHIGLDPAGLLDRGNGGRGIDLQTGSGPTTVGGVTASDRNVISGNGTEGIIVWGTDGNTIIGNYLGTDVTGNTAIPNTNDGLHVGSGADNNTFGQPGAGNIISGNGNDGIEIDDVSSGNIIHANTIGLGPDGSTVVANARYGV